MTSFFRNGLDGFRRCMARLAGGPIQTPSRLLWRKYVMWARKHPRFAFSMPGTLAERGPIRVHPAYYRHGWEKDDDQVFKALAEAIRPGDTVFDIGANLGLTALIASARTGPQGRVVAFEPSPPNVAILRFHLKKNGAANARVETSCVGSTTGTTEFSLIDDGIHSSNSMTFSRKAEVPYVESSLQQVTVPVTTVDAYCAASGLTPQVIKIDVEGAELEVLLGAVETIRRARPLILMGVHPFWWPDDQDPAAITALLNGLDYTTRTTLGENGPPEIYADFVCVPLNRPA
jgi:FkbM family methyltransferase